MMEIRVNLGTNSYDILLKRHLLSSLAQEGNINLNRKVMIVSDSHVPKQYIDVVVKQCKEPFVFIFPTGEKHKTLQTFTRLQKAMLTYAFTRQDCVIAVGGGIVGDLAGFAASCYMRGIDFYNIPTTVLAQVDSSIGGKTAVNLDNVKNIVGTFYQPKKVLIDGDVLQTLNGRHISNGLVEALKMACCFDKDLFNLFLTENPFHKMDEIIKRALLCKKKVVEVDEKEQGLRKVLNFGHTIGHGIESTALDGTLLHGECVALGMLLMSSEPVKKDLQIVLKKLNIPLTTNFVQQSVITAISHDKKSVSDGITVVYCDRIGHFEIKKMSLNEITMRLSEIKGDR